MKNALHQQAIIYLCLLVFGLSNSCSKKSTEPDTEPGFQLGKNNYTMDIDGITREYIVHVPAGYDENNSTPAVFMLHAASGSGEVTYKNSGWQSLGENENILTIYPTALVYCYEQSSGGTKTTTRWNSLPGVATFCQGQTLQDDVKFLRQVVTELHQRFNVDSQRIYMVGFSSGAQMSFRCAVEMSDVLAAVVQSGGTHQVDTVFTPQRNLPISFFLGNKEPWYGNGVSWSLSLFDSALTNYPLFQKITNVHTNSFDFEQTYTMTGDTNSVLVATFKSIPDVGNRQFNFAFVKGLDHSYPNGSNHPMYGAGVHWEWLKQYTLP
ncbi:MAG: hypothetical protein DWQ05_16420 [Calditrichaeota bacterium]|nr:MAG: hypothetical protein DWQ05_16420 [Calditrichota bacterium]